MAIKKIATFLCVQGLVLGSGFAFAGQAAEQKSWTWLYCKMMSQDDLEHNKIKTSLTYAKEEVPLFSQLLFSWDAVRPEHGYFTFEVQARDAQTKEWGPWHTMAAWGSGVQRAFISRTDKLTSYHFVRLEVNQKKLADAFRVRIMPQEGAELSLVKAIAVSLSNFDEFKPELVDDHLTSLSSVYVDHVPKKSQFMVDHQDKDGFCSPTSSSMLASFLTRQDVDVVTFARNVFDEGLNAYGNWPFNTAYLYELTKGDFWTFVARLNSFVRLHAYLTAGLPVVVSVRGYIKGAPKSYTGGHFLMVVGWDAKKREVICHDPAFKSDNQVVARYAAADFLAAWERSRRLIYLVEPNRS